MHNGQTPFFAVQCFAVIGLMTGLGTMQAGLIRYLGKPGWWFGYQMTVQISTLLLILCLHPQGLNVSWQPWFPNGLALAILGPKGPVASRHPCGNLFRKHRRPRGLRRWR